MNEQLAIDTAAIIAAIEADLAAQWQPPHDAEIERDVNTGGWVDFAIALGIWVAWGCIAVGVMWLLG